MSRLGLSMIVKDEAPVIERCLRSVLPLIDWWVVCDTGSTDGTQALVRATLDGVPGRLLERPWVDFGHNRQEALDAARELPASRPGDYALWIDADNQLVDLPDPATVTDGLPLTHDGYHLEVQYGAHRYQSLAVVRLDRPWRWRGVVHEHLELPGAVLGDLDAPRLRAEHSGARSRDAGTYRRDAVLLAAELERHPGDPRTQFYLAQSWRDAGDLEQALAAYRVRAANPAGWHQERWYALLQVAVCLERLGRPSPEVFEAYLAACAADASRAEPLVELARHEREHGRHGLALLYARSADALERPGADALFVDVDTYAWRAADEVAISCYWTGRYAEGRAAARRALAARPDDVRLQENLGFFRGKA